jgi:hypothetical protein
MNKNGVIDSVQIEKRIQKGVDLVTEPDDEMSIIEIRSFGVAFESGKMD